MEYLDLYDKDKNLTGEKILRGNAKQDIPEGKFINIAIIFIENNKHEFLLQMTSKKRNSQWATTGGHVQSGYNSKNTIVKETKEELGLDISHESFKLIKTLQFKSVLFDVYYLKKDLDINNLTLQKEEVDYVKWLTIEEINTLILENKLRQSNINAFKEIINYVNKV